MRDFLKTNYVTYLLAILPTTSALAFSRVQTKAGAEVHWTAAGVTIQRDTLAPSEQLSDDQVQKALQSALTAWSELPESHVKLTLGADAVNPTAKSGTPTLNFVRFRQSDWPYEHTMLAFTQLYTHPSSGEIVSATIEVNEQDNHFFGPDDQPSHASNLYDLQAVLTHEMGHLIGLGHSTDDKATMYRSTAPFDTHQRTPDDDDRQGVAALFDQSGGNDGGTTPSAAPAHGCSVAPGRTDAGQHGTTVVMFGLALAALAFRRSRRLAA